MNKKIANLSLPLFFIWPLGGFICTFYNIKSKLSGLIFILFCMVFGYSFSFTDTTADSYRIAYVFSRFDYSSFEELISTYRNGQMPDLYRFILYNFTKLFSVNPKVLFALAGFGFGITCYKGIRLFIKEKGEQTNLYILILFVVFFSLNPIANINGFRFWTATWLAFISGFNFLFYNRDKWLIGLLITPLVHFSFLFVIPYFILFKFFKKITYNNKGIPKWVLVIYIVTFLLSWILDTNVIKLDGLNGLLGFSGSIENKVDLYNSDQITEVINERQTSLFHRVNKLFSSLIKILFFMIIIKVYNILKIFNNQSHNRLFAFILTFTSFSYIAAIIPSGGRFLTLAYLFLLILILRLFKEYPTKGLKRSILWMIPVFSYSVLFSIVFLSYRLVEPSLWFGNVFWIILEGMYYKVTYTL